MDSIQIFKEPEEPQEQSLKKEYKFNFQTRNKTRLCDSKIRTQKPITKTQNVQNKCENGFFFC
jgi:hypothetical protein